MVKTLCVCVCVGGCGIRRRRLAHLCALVQSPNKDWIVSSQQLGDTRIETRALIAFVAHQQLPLARPREHRCGGLGREGRWRWD